MVSGLVAKGLRSRNDMTDSLNEQLSACLDGQLPAAELDLLVRQVSREGELRGTLGRYALIGEALRGQGAAGTSSGFADRVAAAIAAESFTSSRDATVGPAIMRWLRPAAGMAVAAGVAAVAVFSFQAPTPDAVTTVAQNPANVTSPAADSYIVPATTATSFVPATRLTNYVVAHSEYSSPLGRRTVLSGVLSEEDEINAVAADADEITPEQAGIAVQDAEPVSPQH
jgi:sigma-E factor negative regulatory protein RseA